MSVLRRVYFHWCILRSKLLFFRRAKITSYLACRASILGEQIISVWPFLLLFKHKRHHLNDFYLEYHLILVKNRSEQFFKKNLPRNVFSAFLRAALALCLIFDRSFSHSQMYTPIHTLTLKHKQCDQIGLLLKCYGGIFSYKISPNIGQLCFLFKNSLFYVKKVLTLFWVTLVKIGWLLILASGHTADTSSLFHFQTLSFSLSLSQHFTKFFF